MGYLHFALLAVIFASNLSVGQDFTITVLKYERTNTGNGRTCYTISDNYVRCVNEGNNGTTLFAKGSDGNIYTLMSQSVGNRLDYMQRGPVAHSGETVLLADGPCCLAKPRGRDGRSGSRASNAAF